MEEAIENIDIGGPAMLRSAAKNHKDVIALMMQQTSSLCLQILHLYSDNVRSRYAKQPVKFSTSNAISAPRYS